ncbi:hypothetical protein L6467_05835 [Segatella bryantii]|jgi:hypothetical protein|uniref:hypothetical protein n=1 Tax=Segatella bryantii TaxID=77095 RepID=UPI001EDC8D24|nr:hypothetical protein [Segatella bryantii]UKK73928.1 hypothetical protein L6467_05835 [Segatella bryantii]
MKETDFTTYYDRTMDDSFISKVLGDYPWLIKFVKKTPELDFQTGHDPRQGRSWFSVYKGTGRVITFVSRRNGYKIDAADAYKRIAPIVFFEHPTENSFVEYLSNIREAPNLQRYYESDQGKKEGFYQNLIGRRYTFNTKAEDDFIIIDKEMVVGFKDEVTKTAWNKDIISNIEALIRNLRRDYKGRLPKDISSKYGEFDFLAMTWDGDIIIMELKQDDSLKTSLSPIQVRFYDEQFHKLLKENKDISDNIMKMVQQKVDMGIINVPKGRSLPQKLSGKIETCVIVGEEKSLSPTICDRFRVVRKIFLPNMKSYTCESDGTLVKSNKLT